jgi:hypothetical protein
MTRYRTWPMSLGLEFVVVLMQVDLGVAEPQRFAPGTKCQLLHTEYLRVKPRGGVQIGDGQKQMIQPVDVHSCRVSQAHDPAPFEPDA